jgi:hypothetical protein
MREENDDRARSSHADTPGPRSRAQPDPQGGDMQIKTDGEQKIGNTDQKWSAIKEERRGDGPQRPFFIDRMMDRARAAHQQYKGERYE